jgi:DNA-binding GntR family transcriptional regulator
LVTALAAERSGADDIARLKAILGEAAALMADSPPDWRRFIRIDSRLHITIAEIAGNPIYTAVHRMIHDIIMGDKARFSLFLSEEGRLRENYRDLCGIVAAVEARDSRLARRLAERHVRRSTRRMKAAAVPRSSGGSGD